jgi:DNA-binding response OmpR family regulator
MLKAFNAGSNDYISKPFRKEQLLAIVSKHMPASN